MVGETIKMRRNEGVASARPPQAVDAEALHFEKGNFLHLGRTGNVVNAQARTEFLTVGDAVGKRILEIAAQVVVGLHRHNVRAISQKQHIFGNLEVMRPCVVAAGEKADRLQPARIRGIQDRHAVTEHVADINMAAVEHNLDAVRTTAKIAVRQMTDAAPNALRRNRSFFRSACLLRKAQRRR